MQQKLRWRVLSIALSLAIVFAGFEGTFRVSEAKSAVVKLNSKNKRLKVGKKFQLKIKKQKKIVILQKKFSKKGSAVTVTKKGKIRAKKPGKATVYCKVKYRKKNTGKTYRVKLKCKVTVSGTESASENVSKQSTALPDSEKQNTPNPGTAEPTESTSGSTEVPNPDDETSQPTAGSTESPSTGDGTAQPAITEPTPAATTAATPTAAPSTEEETENLASFQLVHDMGLGINLGNTMEAYCAGAATTSQLETNWGQPITTQAIITGMKNAGFHSLRIPVSWSSMMSDDGNYTIDTALLQRIETIINYALQEDMYAIINIHWDGQWWGQFGDEDSTVRAKAWARYEAFWTQISEYYKGYSDHLIFESANEELGERLNDNWQDTSGDQTGVLTEDECYEMVNAINQKFVDIVRASGENNETRYLLIAGYNTDIDKTCDSRYELPADTIDGHMMVSIHYYSPATYCISSDPDNSWGYDASWGTDDDIAAMKAQLAKMRTIFADQGIPVVIGEYGVTDTYEDGDYARKEGRDVFFKTICEYAIDHGMCPMLWDTGQIYSRSTCTVTNSIEAANYLALAEVAEENEIYQPAGTPEEYVWSGILECESYTQYVNTRDEESNFFITENGGSFILSGVDWDHFDNPVIEFTSSGIVGSCYCKFATSVEAPESYWPYIGNDPDIYAASWTFGDTLVISLSDKNLAGKQALYFSLNGNDFTGNITIRIRESS